MRYNYFPGCTLQTTAAEYDISARAVMRTLDAELAELPDWNCCGATAADAVSYLMSVALPARNLALTEGMPGDHDLVTFCSSCYLNLFRVNEHLALRPGLKLQVDEVLAAAGLKYTGTTRVRHLLDVIVNDIGLDAVRRHVRYVLDGLKVVPYYGCQVVRPFAEFDGPDLPESMDRLINALGGEVVPFAQKTRCCGGVLMTARKGVALKLVGDILAEARGADVIVTVCPMCQINLDAYQGQIARQLRTRLDIPVLYFTQLMGLAFGLGEEDIRLNSTIVPAEPLRRWAA
jgi:heterodisulfide reductase subunit B